MTEKQEPITINVHNAAADPHFWTFTVTPDGEEARALESRIQKAVRKAIRNAFREAGE
jgi:hypothetical protein